MKTQSRFVSVIVTLLIGLGSSQAQTTLQQNFQKPPNAAQPRVWWHWMNGNITQSGIQKDLEWMKRVGIGGFQNFDASLFTPQVVKERLIYMTPKWKEAFRLTTQLADKLGLEMAIAGSPGWSESGGPWVPAKDGMKKYVWTETLAKGGQPFTGKLPQPSVISGVFQNVPNEKDPLSQDVPETPTFFADVAVFAYQLPATDKLFTDLKPKITSSGGTFDLAALTDGDLAKSTYLPPVSIGENAWIQFGFDTPQTFKALSIVGGGGGYDLVGTVSNRNLEASDDGVTFRLVAPIPVSSIPQTTLTFTPTTAKYFRITYKTVAPPPSIMTALMGAPAEKQEPKGTNIAEIVFHTVYRINRLEEKAAFTTTPDLPTFITPPTTDAIAPSEVVDLTAKMKPDGTLDWTPPAGNWTVVRLGYSLTGRQNHPASPEATGLEVDKMDATAVKNYLENYLDQYKDASGGLMGKRGLNFMVLDSYEAGGENWTGAMMTEFARRRGYDMKPWLPVLTGHIVKSTEASEQFLWDFRKTIADLITENHYDQIGDLLHKRGMGRYTESHEYRRALMADGMEIKRKADIPMAAIWTPSNLGLDDAPSGEAIRHQADIRESASVAHIYGQNLVAAESLTAFGHAFTYSPENLKRTADVALSAGLNRFVIHTSVHQPLDDKMPGLSLGPFGQWFTRQETWAEQAKPWMDYLSRSCYLLQQGKFVADVLYYYGEDTNITALFSSKLPTVPPGYNYDFVNADALINVLGVKDGRLTTPSGMRYRVLVLGDNVTTMSLPVLRKLSELVKGGAVIMGNKPAKTPSLSDNQAEFQSLVQAVWGAPKANVRTGQSLESVLSGLRIPADFTYTKPRTDTEIVTVHRQLPDQDIYWVFNRNDRAEEIDATFRVAGKTAEIWHPEMGQSETVSYRISNGLTTVPLRLEPSEAYFVVFKGKASSPSFTKAKPSEKQLLAVESPWQVSFQPDRGAPNEATFNQLTSWTDNAVEGIKYFSGTASYQTTVNVPALPKGGVVELDLGSVKNLAEVIVNGKSMGIVWKKPFRLVLSDGLKAGANSLTIKVTNVWVNRLIGDQQPGMTTKITYTTLPFYKADSPLLPAGLLGPVRLLVKQ